MKVIKEVFPNKNQFTLQHLTKQFDVSHREYSG